MERVPTSAAHQNPVESCGPQPSNGAKIVYVVFPTPRDMGNDTSSSSSSDAPSDTSALSSTSSESQKDHEVAADRQAMRDAMAGKGDVGAAATCAG